MEINNKFISKQAAFYKAGAVDCEITVLAVVLLYIKILSFILSFILKTWFCFLNVDVWWFKNNFWLFFVSFTGEEEQGKQH